MPNLTIGELKRASLYLAGQLASAVAITGGTVVAKLSDALVETASTATNMSNGGTSLLTSTAATTFTLDAPTAGVYKFIRNTQAASNIAYTGSSLVSIGGNSTQTRITFAGQSGVMLKGESATKWGIYGPYPSTLVSLSS